MRGHIPSGRWRNSRVFEDVNVATELKIPISSLWSWDEEDQAYVIAYYRVKATMHAYEELLHDREMSRNKKKPNQKSTKPKRRR